MYLLKASQCRYLTAFCLYQIFWLYPIKITLKRCISLLQEMKITNKKTPRVYYYSGAFYMLVLRTTISSSTP